MEQKGEMVSQTKVQKLTLDGHGSSCASTPREFWEVINRIDILTKLQKRKRKFENTRKRNEDFDLYECVSVPRLSSLV